MDVWSAAVTATGGIIVLLGLSDAFLTILHPDRDGKLTAILNRTIWRVSVVLARLRPKARQETLGFAGPSMVIGDILLWMILPIFGYGLMIWPFLAGGFDAPPSIDMDLWDAIYFSGVTFTTLGFGDITPIARFWEILAIGEAITGFLVMGTSIAYIVAVFEGVDQRDALALKVYSETGATWNGAAFVARTLDEEGPMGLRGRVEGWATLVRDLHGRLYRFHGLALYLRTHGLELGPERMLYTLADVSVRVQVVARAPMMRALRASADHLSIGVEHFARAVVRRHGSAATQRAIEHPQPTAADVQLIRDAWESAAMRFHLDAPPTHPAEDQQLLELACRMRVFLGELDRLTRWRTLDRANRDRATP